ncbi:unnamed protein product [Rhizophagus irregularis]|uniref:Uncharacterized protein n=1 Tax=Rhizophagus irregularis TaxID=588596 RepID=A0A2I1GF42_9GLOM|nr:hypothetical protein RhiirA4_459762 [Rhizophagus irregularis]CAB4432124.1 unnamed protein product [Rhizophagus irregularis]CAB4432364.1 unnamed protein product [Rhizophagus irregularis]
MPKHRSITVSLVDFGSIIEEFHYGPYSRYWWKITTDKKKGTYFPLRVGQKTKTCLNNYNNVVVLGYLYQSDTYISQIENDPSKAIFMIYVQIFENGIRFSDSLVLGWQDKNIIHQLLKNVLFVPILILVDFLKIFVYKIKYLYTE